jgi:hypothetical protein
MVITEEVKPVSPRTYPWLGEALNGQVVLFHSSNCGIVLVKSLESERKVGRYSDMYNMDCFKPYTGTLTLSN